MTCDDIHRLPLLGGRNVDACVVCVMQNFAIDIMLRAIPSNAQDHRSVCIAVFAIGRRQLSMTVSEVLEMVHFNHGASQRRRTSGFSAG